MNTFPLTSAECPDIASSYVGGSKELCLQIKTISRTFTNNLPIPSTDENDGAEGYGAVGYAFGVESVGKEDGGIFGIP